MPCARRIIPELSVRDGRLEHEPGSTRGEGPRPIGEHLADADSIELARHFAAVGADEIMLTGVDTTHDRRSKLSEIVESVAREVFVPLAVRADIATVAQIRSLLWAGADRVVLCETSVGAQGFAEQAVRQFGRERILIPLVVSPRTTREEDGDDVPPDPGSGSGSRVELDRWQVRHAKGSRSREGESGGAPLGEVLDQLRSLPLGELLVIDAHATQKTPAPDAPNAPGTPGGDGLALDAAALEAIAERVGRSVLVARRDGWTAETLIELFRCQGLAGIVGAAAWFAGPSSIPRLKRSCRRAGVPVRLSEGMSGPASDASRDRTSALAANVPTPAGPAEAPPDLDRAWGGWG